MEGLSFLGGFEKEIVGKSVYMVVGNKQHEKLKVFDMGNDNTPRFVLDWLVLNYFQNNCDLMLVSVIFI